MRNDQKPHLLVGHEDSAADELTPLPFDVWTAASALQKSIRRGEITTAQRAALTLLRWRGRATWRRVVVIACEDVGLASIVDVLHAVEMAAEMSTGKRAGEIPRLLTIVDALSRAPKDRSADLLASAVHHHPDLEPLRDEIGALPVAKRIELAVDPDADFMARAIATWMASGIEWGRERRLRGGDLPGLLSAFADRGIFPLVSRVAAFAAKTTREPLTVMLLPLSTGLRAAETVSNYLPAPRVVGGVPLYALDKHTRLGLATFSVFVRENLEVRRVLAATVPKPRWRSAVAWAAFYADAALLARRMRWPRGDDVERLGIEADLMQAGVPRDGIGPLCAAVAAQISCLDDIRERLLLDQLGGTP